MVLVGTELRSRDVANECGTSLGMGECLLGEVMRGMDWVGVRTWDDWNSERMLRESPCLNTRDRP